MDALERENSDLKRENSDLKRENSDLLTNYIRLGKKYQEVMVNNPDLYDFLEKIARLQTGKARLKVEIKKLEEEISELQAESCLSHKRRTPRSKTRSV